MFIAMAETWSIQTHKINVFLKPHMLIEKA